MGRYYSRALQKTSIPLDEEAFRTAQERSQESVGEDCRSGWGRCTTPLVESYPKKTYRVSLNLQWKLALPNRLIRNREKPMRLVGNSYLDSLRTLTSGKGIRGFWKPLKPQDIDRLLKPKEQVAKEQQAQMQAALQAEIAKDQPKRDTDMAKTQAKTQSSEKIAQGKNRTNLITALASQQKTESGVKK